MQNITNTKHPKPYNVNYKMSQLQENDPNLKMSQLQNASNTKGPNRTYMTEFLLNALDNETIFVSTSDAVQ